MGKWATYKRRGSTPKDQPPAIPDPEAPTLADDGGGEIRYFWTDPLLPGVDGINIYADTFNPPTDVQMNRPIVDGAWIEAWSPGDTIWARYAYTFGGVEVSNLGPISSLTLGP